MEGIGKCFAPIAEGWRKAQRVYAHDAGPAGARYCQIRAKTAKIALRTIKPLYFLYPILSFSAKIIP